MTKEDLVKLMNKDLQREYEHWFTYMQACTSVKGLHRLELEEFFWDEAKDEMEHIKELALRIRGINGEPVSNTNLKINDVESFMQKHYKSVSNPDGSSWNNYNEIQNLPNFWLDIVLVMEQEVVAIFAERIKQTEELGGSDGMSLHVFYEDMINDSRKTVDKVKMLLSM